MKKPQRLKLAPFAKTLKALMKERSLTMREVGKMAGISPSTVNDWQSGSTPENYMAVKKLAKELDVSFSFLLTGEEEAKFKNQLPSVTEVFDDGGELFDGYAKITIQRLIPRKKKDEAT